MRAIVLAVALLATSSVVVQAQTAEEKHAVAVALVNESSGLDLWPEFAIPMLQSKRGEFEQLMKKQANPLPFDIAAALYLDEFQREMTRLMPTLVDEVATEYEAIYSYEEMQELRGFFATPLGQKFRRTAPDLHKRVRLVLERRQNDFLPPVLNRLGSRLRAMGFRPPAQQR